MTEEQVRRIIREELSVLFAVDRITLQKNIQIFDARNIQFGRTNGTQIGTATNQKLAFYGVTPVVQQVSPSAPTGGGTASTDAIDISGRSAINAIRAILTTFGLTN